MNMKEKICDLFNIDDIGDLSDGFHTFNQLYHQRMMLFAVIVKQNKSKAWKSLKHEDGEYCFGGGWFIVGIDTPEGSYTYHYKAEYYDLFDCQELPIAKHWDGHTEKDVTRLLSLNKPNEWIPVSERLPRIGQDVLVTFRCEYYVDDRTIVKSGIAKTHRNGNKSWSQFLDGEVVAWMELPKPYEVEK